MSLILDPATERHLQQELAAGRYRDPSALIAHALDLVQGEREADDAKRASSAGLESSAFGAGLLTPHLQWK